MASIISAPRPISQSDQPNSSEKAILALLSKWQTRTSRVGTPTRNGQEVGTLAVLVPFSPQAEPIRIPLCELGKGRLRIGSDSVSYGETDISLSGPNINKEHCLFSWDPREGISTLIQIIDKSVCGISVNDERMTYSDARYLQDQDIITLAPKDPKWPTGDYRYVFRYAESMSRVREISVQPQVVAPNA